MKKPKKYTELPPSASGQCVHEPATEYQAMKRQLPPQVMKSIEISEAQIARGEAVDYETVMERWEKKVEL